MEKYLVKNMSERETTFRWRLMMVDTQVAISHTEAALFRCYQIKEMIHDELGVPMENRRDWS